jgi:hypothetical protein
MPSSYQFVLWKQECFLVPSPFFRILLGFQPGKDLNPCTDLENRPAKVEYVESANPSVTAQIVSIELHK